MDNIIRLLGTKAFMSILLLAITIVALCFEHSFRACAATAVIALIVLGAVYDGPDPEAA